MTLNYHMIVEKMPKPNELVGGSIPGREIVSLLDGKLASLYHSLSVNELWFLVCRRNII